ncbi:MAG: hypothetical protein LBQ60_12310 [Bacteroidales bacterium]|jgi:hypothetical protein|nr:hypothetical protein [Bacteroidales bacterium]
MINFIIVSDDRDDNLGVYFNDCKNQILGLLEELKESLEGSINEISGNQCNSAYIDLKVPTYHPNPFIFIAYSHGNEYALCSQEDNYVEKGANTQHFTNSLFYTTACSAGKELGPHLVEQGCLAFVGYENEINAYKKDEQKEISKNCDNAGIVSFLSEDITIYESYKRMKNYYTQQIDRLEDVKDMMFAMNLIQARESLVCLGDKNLKKEDFFVA